MKINMYNENSIRYATENPCGKSSFLLWIHAQFPYSKKKERRSDSHFLLGRIEIYLFGKRNFSYFGCCFLYFFPSWINANKSIFPLELQPSTLLCDLMFSWHFIVSMFCNFGSIFKMENSTDTNGVATVSRTVSPARIDDWKRNCARWLNVTDDTTLLPFFYF